ncbi:MAG TPA: YncE family protein, partial [Solirubrobacteraceae bacterium]
MPPGIRTDALAVTPSGRTIWTTDSSATTITAHRIRDLQRGRSIDVGGAPIAIAIAPDAPTALVLTAFYDRPALAIVDLVAGEVTRLKVGPDPRAVAFTRSGKAAYVAGGDGTLTKVDPYARRVHDPVKVGAQPRDVVVTSAGVLVALNGEAAVALVKGTSVRKIATADYPHQVAAAGARALVTHSGAGARRVSLLDLERRRVTRRLNAGLEPAGVAVAGTRAVVTAGGSGKVAVFDLRTGRRRSRAIGGRPRAVAIAGTRAIVADGVTGQLTKVR